jgi:hypothetical protein
MPVIVKSGFSPSSRVEGPEPAAGAAYVAADETLAVLAPLVVKEMAWTARGQAAYLSLLTCPLNQCHEVLIGT